MNSQTVPIGRINKKTKWKRQNLATHRCLCQTVVDSAWTRPIPCLLMPWFLVSWGHLQVCHWPCKVIHCCLPWLKIQPLWSWDWDIPWELGQYSGCWSVGELIGPWEILTHWGRNKMAAFSQTTLSNAFSWMKILEFRLKIHWNLFLRVLLTIFQHWFW